MIKKIIYENIYCREWKKEFDEKININNKLDGYISNFKKIEINLLENNLLVSTEGEKEKNGLGKTVIFSTISYLLGLEKYKGKDPLINQISQIANNIIQNDKTSSNDFIFTFSPSLEFEFDNQTYILKRNILIEIKEGKLNYKHENKFFLYCKKENNTYEPCDNFLNENTPERILPMIFPNWPKQYGVEKFNKDIVKKIKNSKQNEKLLGDLPSKLKGIKILKNRRLTFYEYSLFFIKTQTPKGSGGGSQLFAKTIFESNFKMSSILNSLFKGREFDVDKEEFDKTINNLIDKTLEKMDVLKSLKKYKNLCKFLKEDSKVIRSIEELRSEIDKLSDSLNKKLLLITKKEIREKFVKIFPLKKNENIYDGKESLSDFLSKDGFNLIEIVEFNKLYNEYIKKVSKLKNLTENATPKSKEIILEQIIKELQDTGEENEEENLILIKIENYIQKIEVFLSSIEEELKGIFSNIKRINGSTGASGTIGELSAAYNIFKDSREKDPSKKLPLFMIDNIHNEIDEESKINETLSIINNIFKLDYFNQIILTASRNNFNKQKKIRWVKYNSHW